MKPDIAVRMCGKSPVIRDRHPGQNHRSGAVAETMYIEAGACADVGCGAVVRHECLSVSGQGRQNGKILRCRQLPQAFVAGNGGYHAARRLHKLDVVGDLACVVMPLIE